jgi:predicted PurR-regulated permease PerM
MTNAVDPAATHARQRWSLLRERLSHVTPEGLGRGLLAVAAIAVAGTLAAGTWPALAPFFAGAVIAYAVLPVANRLDAFMPRVLAALLAELLALAIVVGVIVIIVPPLVNGLSLVATQLPTGDALDERLAALQASIGSLPEPARSIVLSVATEVATNLQAALAGFVDGIAAFVTRQILGIFETVSFVLGLLVIPVWVLTVVADQRGIRKRALNAVAPAIRDDVYALIRIADRTFGTFLRVQVVQALLVGVLVWGGLTLAERLGLVEMRYEVAAGAILGVVQVIPQLGFLVGFLPLLLILAVSGPTTFLVALVVYLGANRLAGSLVGTTVSRRVMNVHPALMIPGLVAIGQLGLVPLLFGAPLIVLARDTVRYLNGRLSDRPKPAGVLPGERGWSRPPAQAGAPAPATVSGVPASVAAATSGPSAPSVPPVPSVYRRPAPPVLATPVPAASPAWGTSLAPAATPGPTLRALPSLLPEAGGPASAQPQPATQWSAIP